jgi:CRP-like cAMP-binding protein
MKDILRTVPWLSAQTDGVLDELIAASREVRFSPGATLVAELEAGTEMYIVLEGSARATVAAGRTEPLEVGTLGPGDTCGELALVTRELRSATVTATSPLRALRLDRAALDALLSRHPRIAVHLAEKVGARLGDADAALDRLLSGGADAPEVQRLVGHAASITPTRGSLRRAWTELIASRAHDLPFQALASFLTALVVIRLSVWLATMAGAPLFGLLRAAYTAGFLLVLLSTGTALLRFRPSWRRAIAVAWGVGFALLVNEYSVFLAFDVFYVDMTTRDTSMIFSVEELYRRSESQWAIATFVLVLLQATYFGRFYRRVWFIIATRVSKAFS